MAQYQILMTMSGLEVPQIAGLSDDFVTLLQHILASSHHAVDVNARLLEMVTSALNTS